MNIIDAKRADIAAALSTVLPDGRFTAYPRPMTRGIAPAGWIEQSSGSEQSAGGNATKVVTTFPIWFVYDGTDEAQVAGLEDVMAQAWAAVAVLPQIHPRRWRPATLPTVTNTATGEQVTVLWRAVVLEVDCTVLAASFCPPVTAPATIPPEIVYT